MNFKGGESVTKAIRITGKVDFSGDHPMIDHFRFVKDNTEIAKAAKMTIPSPEHAALSRRPEGDLPDVYPDMDGFFEDLAQTYARP